MDVSLSVFDTLIDRSDMSSDKWAKYPGKCDSYVGRRHGL